MRSALQIPRELALDPTIPPLAKSLYIAMRHKCPCSLQTLSAASQIHRNVARGLVHLLADSGWAVIDGTSNRKVVRISSPLEVQRATAWRLKEHRTIMPYVGEGLTKRVLDVGVDDDDYVDNARPWYLPNRDTGEPLEIDRLYVGIAVGIEYGGIQHSEVTQLFPDPRKLAELRSRDARKAELCQSRGVTLVTIGEDDLSVERVLDMLPPQLARAHIDPNDLYIKTLNDLCGQYVANCKKYRMREQRQAQRNAQRNSEQGR